MFAELTPYLVGLGAAALAVTAWLAVGGATTRRLALRQINRRRGEAALVVVGSQVVVVGDAAVGGGFGSGTGT